MNTNKGNNSNVAGGDIIIHNYGNSDLEKSFHDIDDFYEVVLSPKFEHYDKRIHSVIPSGKVHKKNHFETFKAERLFTSLHELGIPLKAVFFVLEKLDKALSKSASVASNVTTRDITYCVSQLLYSYDATINDQKRKDLWGDLYIRVYGDPERQIEVLFSSGPDFLSKGLFKKRIYDDLLQSIAAKQLPIVNMGINGEQKNVIIDECLRQINRLQLYRIHFDTVITICSEIALQPPHPWFVKMDKNIEAVQYDYKKAHEHYSALENNFNSGELETAFSDFSELLHHSSSAFLAYFGIYMGCGYRVPLYTLERVLKKLHSPQKSFDLEVQKKVAENILSELKKHDISLPGFHSLTQTLIGTLSLGVRSPQGEISRAFKKSQDLYDIVKKIISPLMKFNDIDISAVNAENAFNGIARDLLQNLNGVSFEEKNTNWWLRVDSGKGIFKNIHCRIICKLSFSLKNVLDDFHDSIKAISNPILTNTIFFITKEKLDVCLVSQIGKQASEKNLILLCIDIETLYHKLKKTMQTEDIFKEIMYY